MISGSEPEAASHSAAEAEMPTTQSGGAEGDAESHTGQRIGDIISAEAEGAGRS